MNAYQKIVTSPEIVKDKLEYLNCKQKLKCAFFAASLEPEDQFAKDMIKNLIINPLAHSNQEIKETCNRLNGPIHQCTLFLLFFQN